MNFKLYKNELIVAMSLLIMLSGIFYKNSQISSGIEEMLNSKHTIRDFRELISLKKVWANKNISKKVDKLKKVVPASKVKWNKRGKKLTATYSGLNAKELNKLITTILSMSIQIKELKIERDKLFYNVEFKCKW